MTEPQRELALRGRVAVVTGGARGLGCEAVAAIAAAGADVIVVSRHATDGQSVASAIGEASGSSIAALDGDVGADGGAVAIVERALELHGRIDILVNAAGSMVRGDLMETTEADFHQMMRVNAFGTWAMCRAVRPHMEERGGVILNFASAAGLVGYSSRSAYGASKGAVVQITRCLASELAPLRIRVNAIAPGPFEAGMAANRGSSDQMIALLEHRVPMGRMASPSELSGAVVFLVSDAASFITGAVLPVDGGWTAS